MDVMLQLDCLNMSVSDNANQAIVKVEPNPLLQQFQRGECFTSFEEFLSILSQYQQQNHVFFVRESGERLKFEPTLMERLVYKNVLFVCKQGRRKDPPRAKIRPNQTTLKVGCKAFLRVGLKQQVNGEYCLEVKSSRLEHNNHPVSAENAIKYPENRRVSMNDKIKDLVTKPNMRSKDVLEIIKNEQDKSLSSKDLYNLKRKLQSEDNPSITSFPSKPSPVQKQKVMKLEERLVLLEPLLHKGWSVCSDKDAIQKEFIFSNFNEAFRFITGIGLESNRMGHYPEWHNYNSKVGIILQTPSVAGITAKDITLAHYIESLAM